MIAMFIFAIGFVAVAAIFPVGAVLQQQTMIDVYVQQVSNNVKALLQARQITPADLDMAIFGSASPVTNPDYVMHALPDIAPLTPTGNTAGFDQWSLSDRSYPSTVADAGLRGYYWVPLVRQARNSTGGYTWQLYVYVLKRNDGASYTKSSGTWADPTTGTNSDPLTVPGVVLVAAQPDPQNTAKIDFTNWNPNYATGPTSTTDTTALLVRAGDQVVDNNGNIYNVSAADTTSITVSGYVLGNPDNGNPLSGLWVAPGPDSGGPPAGRRVLIVPNAIQ